MNYLAEYRSELFDTLYLGQRKHTPYAQLLYVRNGTVLLRLGKNELMLKSNDTFYLPFDCLSQLTALQGCELDVFTLSPRLKSMKDNKFPEKSGKVTTSLVLPLLHALYASKHDIARTEEQDQHLINVLLDELKLCTPISIDAPIVKTDEIQDQLECRDILRQVKSGKKLDLILQDRPELAPKLQQYTDLL